MTTSHLRYTNFNIWLRERYGCRVQKITVDAGMSCPNRDGSISASGCIFCNARGSGTGAYEKGLTVFEQLSKGKVALGKRYKAKKFIAYFQSYSNTYAPINMLSALYEEALAVDDIVGLSIGTRPDCVNESVLALLQKYAQNYLIWLEYGIQSVHNKTLALINRGHTFRCFEDAVKKSKNRGIKICAHVILGLPNENKQAMLETAKAMADLKIDGIKIHLLYVVKGTPLAHLYNTHQYKCLEKMQYIDIVCDFLERLAPETVIQRLTGEPHPAELIAPLWSLNKAETLSLINAEMEKRNSWQGKFRIHG